MAWLVVAKNQTFWTVQTRCPGARALSCYKYKTRGSGMLFVILYSTVRSLFNCALVVNGTEYPLPSTSPLPTLSPSTVD